nr:hypothetical protein [uncultured Campylobacter sp.]
MIKNKNIILRVSEEFRELLGQKASKVGIPISEYLRKSAMNSEIVNYVSKEIDPQIIFNFYRAAENINQIAKATNTIAKQEQISRDFEIKILEALYRNEQLLNQIYVTLKGEKQ